MIWFPERLLREYEVDYERLILVFTSIIYEALPFIVLGVRHRGDAGGIRAAAGDRQLIPAQRVLAIALGGLLGLVFPMCECGIIVVMRRLLRKGLPLSVCVALHAGRADHQRRRDAQHLRRVHRPMANDVIFGGPWFVGRLGASGLALPRRHRHRLLVVEWQCSKARQHACCTPHRAGPSSDRTRTQTASAGPRTWGERVDNITQTALHDFVDIMAFLILGAFLAAAGGCSSPSEQPAGRHSAQPGHRNPADDGHRRPVVPVQRGRRLRGRQFPAYWPVGVEAGVPGARADARHQVYLMYTRVFGRG